MPLDVHISHSGFSALMRWLNLSHAYDWYLPQALQPLFVRTAPHTQICFTLILASLYLWGHSVAHLSLSPALALFPVRALSQHRLGWLAHRRRMHHALLQWVEGGGVP